MTTILNPEYIRHANSHSHFDAGDSIERDANNTVARFEEHFPSGDKLKNLTQEQIDYLTGRSAQWRDFVIGFYNDYCRRRGEYVPVTVCGPARYPAAKMEKRVDKMMALAGEFKEKADRFFDNTEKRLRELLPLEKELENIRAGKWRYGETIPASDPYIIEKLHAKIEYLESKKHRGMPPFARQNVNANIRTIKDRIARITRERESPTLHGWDFPGGEVVINQNENRLQIVFDEKPDTDMIARLKGEAFHWSRRNCAWQRQLTANAHRAARRIVPPPKG